MWLLHPAPILVLGLDTEQLVLVRGAFPSINYSTCTHGGHHPLQFALVVFFLGALAHLLMCTQTNMHILQLALCGGGGCGCIFGAPKAPLYCFQFR